MARKQLTQWQILVIEQLVNRALEFEKHKYDEASLKRLSELWCKVKTVTVGLED